MLDPDSVSIINKLLTRRNAYHNVYRIRVQDVKRIKQKYGGDDNGILKKLQGVLYTSERNVKLKTI